MGNDNQFASKICNAARMGDLNTVKSVLEESQEAVHSTYLNDSTPLHNASQFGKTEIVKYLLENKADTEARNSDGDTPLFLSIARGNHETVKELIAAGANPHAENDSGISPIHVIKDIEMAEIVFGDEFDVNEVGESGHPILHQYLNDKKLFEFILNRNADVNITDSEGNTALHDISKKEIAQLLIEKGADVNCKNNKGETPLLKAAINNNSMAVSFLFEQEAHVNAVDANGFSVLHYLARYGDSNLVRYAVEKGTDPNVKGKYDVTPLHFAVLGRWEPEFYDGDAISPSYLTTKVLLELGADPKIKNSEGDTPLMVAEKQKNEEVVRLLKEHNG